MTLPPDVPGRAAAADRTVLLVEDGSGVTALAAARSLAAAGWRVVIGTPRGRSVATASRGCHDRGEIRPAGAVSPAEWLADVRALAGRFGARVVVPCGDAELALLSANRDQLPGLVVPYPEHARVLPVLDKLHLPDLARAAGLSGPYTEAAVAGVRPTFGGRVVVKPRTHGPVAGAGRIEAAVVDDATAAQRSAEDVRAAGADAVYQEHVDGWLMAHVVVRSRSGAVLARSHQRASRVYPQPAGNAVRATQEEAPPGLADGVDRLLESLGWWGLVQLEFVADAEGVLHLVDANPRPYGTMALAVGAGLPLCDLWLRDALGEEPVPYPEQPVRTYQALGLDLRRAFEQRAPSLTRDVGATLLAGRRAVRPVWSAQDPAPFLRLFAAVARRLPGRLRRAARARGVTAAGGRALPGPARRRP